MKWETIKLLKNEENGTDRLGNPIKEIVVFDTVKARIEAFKTEEIFEGRQQTITKRRLIIPYDFSILEDVVKIEIDSNIYTVKRKMKYGRFSAVELEGWQLEA